MSRTCVSVDPGLGGTGWAIWQDRVLKKVGVVYAIRDEDTWDTHAVEIAVRLENRIHEEINNPLRVREGVSLYVEFPQVMDSVAGIAATRGGGILKLAFLVGCIVSRPIWDANDTHLVTPMQWKGQLPKEVVINRIKAEMGELTCTRLGIKTHAWDAVGLGLYSLGVWP